MLAIIEMLRRTSPALSSLAGPAPAVPCAPTVKYESKPPAARIPSRFFDRETSLMLPIPVENFVTLYLASTESIDGWLVGAT